MFNFQSKNLRLLSYETPNYGSYYLLFFSAPKKGNLVPWLLKSQELRIYFLGLWVFYFIDIVTILLVLQVIIKEWPGHDNLQSPFQTGTPRIGEGLQVCVE